MTDTNSHYQLLSKQLESLLTNERNLLTNISQFSALVFNNIESINWAGFYINKGNNILKLGPFQGQVACTTIDIGAGVCGTSASQLASIIVEDVDQFEGHIVCDSRSRSELVCPIVVNNRLWGVFDLDSPEIGRFKIEDKLGIEALIAVLVRSTDWQN